MTTKTESPRTTTETTSAPTFPFPMWGATMWQKAIADGAERARAFMDEYTRIETQGLSQARTMMSESARMSVESMNYVAQLQGEWRKVSMEAARRAMELVTPAAR